MLTVDSIYQILPVYIEFHIAPEFMQLTILLREAGQFLRAHTSAFSILSIDEPGLQLGELCASTNQKPDRTEIRDAMIGNTTGLSPSFVPAIPSSHGRRLPRPSSRGQL